MDDFINIKIISIPNEDKKINLFNKLSNKINFFYNELNKPDKEDDYKVLITSKILKLIYKQISILIKLYYLTDNSKNIEIIVFLLLSFKKIIFNFFQELNTISFNYIKTYENEYNLYKNSINQVIELNKSYLPESVLLSKTINSKDYSNSANTIIPTITSTDISILKIYKNFFTTMDEFNAFNLKIFYFNMNLFNKDISSSIKLYKSSFIDDKSSSVEELNQLELANNIKNKFFVIDIIKSSAKLKLYKSKYLETTSIVIKNALIFRNFEKSIMSPLIIINILSKLDNISIVDKTVRKMYNLYQNYGNLNYINFLLTFLDTLNINVLYIISNNNEYYISPLNNKKFRRLL